MAQIHVKHYQHSDINLTLVDGIKKLNTDHDRLIEHIQTKQSGFMSVLSSNNNTIGYSVVESSDESSAKLLYLYVHPACRGNRFGSQLIKKSMEYAHSCGHEFIHFETNNPHKAFFIRNGFVLVREPTHARQAAVFKFERPDLGFYLRQLADSQHDLKRKNLIPLNIPADSHHYKYSSEPAFMSFQRCMMPQAQREIAILCNNIANPLFKDPYIRSCLLNLSKRNASAKIKILLEDDKAGAGYHNPIIDLAHKLSSFIEIRSIPNGSAKPGEMISCVDYDAGIYRKNYDSFNGFANFHNHLIAQRLRDNFQQHWQYAKPSMQLRRLSL